LEDIELGLKEQSNMQMTSTAPVTPVTDGTGVTDLENNKDQLHSLKVIDTSLPSEQPKPVKAQSYYSQMLQLLNVNDDNVYDSDLMKNANGNNVDDNIDYDTNELEMNMTKLLDESSIFGPEQLAMYSCEFAHAVSGCFPKGFGLERKVYKLSIETLITMKQHAEIDMIKAYKELKNARTNIAHGSDTHVLNNLNQPKILNVADTDQIVQMVKLSIPTVLI
jgi:hypothetical protein